MDSTNEKFVPPKVSSTDLKIDLTSRTSPACPDSPPVPVTLRPITPASRVVPASRPKLSRKGSKCSSNTGLSFGLPKKDAVFDKKVRSFITEGEGTENHSIARTAEERVITTSNIDRWKRTFQALKSMLRREEGEVEENSEEEIRMFYEKSKKGTVWTDDGNPDELEDIYEELTQRQLNTSFGIINPDSMYKAIWDCFGLLFTVIQAILIPFRMAFRYNTSVEWGYVEVCIDFYFMLDLRNLFFVDPVF